ncbi:UNVERIFIED_CONTAM: hypothetical protein Slati_3429200 [Sesamum latifolium]|uniref:Uncharacterized protein n=1 Tax=Sesamum latifolium TaxID=2727402 RepID=A0AAW2UGS3_9LAMI
MGPGLDGLRARWGSILLPVEASSFSFHLVFIHEQAEGCLRVTSTAMYLGMANLCGRGAAPCRRIR